MKIAILGASGFIGRELCSLLKWQHHIVPITRKTFDLSSYSATASWIFNTKPDVIINCTIAGGGTELDKIDHTIVQSNLAVFLNFYNNPKCPKFINIGSGAEFDKRGNITAATETDILHRIPADSYGYSKNVIARMVHQRENFYTLRLFGCFGSSESESRLFKRIQQSDAVTIEQKLFDYMSIQDFSKIVDYYCVHNDLIKDINCVYNTKKSLFDTAEFFSTLHTDTTCKINLGTTGLEYTGNGEKLSALPIKLDGLEKGIKEYK